MMMMVVVIIQLYMVPESKSLQVAEDQREYALAEHSQMIYATQHLQNMVCAVITELSVDLVIPVWQQ